MEMNLVTKEEKVKLDQQLKEMIARRPEIAKRIAEAREKGDLKENADYHAARDEMAMLEFHIKNMQERMANTTVIDASEVPEDMVFLGSTVKLKDLDSGDFEVIRLVGEVGKGSFNVDSDVLEVSAKSPLGEALMRTRVGSVVKVRAPRGELNYEVIELL